MLHAAQLLLAGRQRPAVAAGDGLGAGQAPQGPHACLQAGRDVALQAPGTQGMAARSQLHLPQPHL